MAEEQIGRVRDELVHRNFLHAEEHVAAVQFLDHVDAFRSVLVVGDAPDITRLHDELHFRVQTLQLGTLGRGEGHPLIGWHFAFSNDTNLHTSNVAPGPPV